MKNQARNWLKGLKCALEKGKRKINTLGSSFQLFVSCQVVINCWVSELKLKIEEKFLMQIGIEPRDLYANLLNRWVQYICAAWVVTSSVPMYWSTLYWQSSQHWEEREKYWTNFVVLLAKVVLIAVSYHHLVCNLTRLVYIASSHRLL